MRRLGTVALIATVGLGLLPPGALAQVGVEEPTPMMEARRLFVAGQAAVDEGRWADAVTSFGRAYELSGVPAAQYNVAFALRALGRHRESRDAFAALLAAHPDVDPEMREEAQRLMAGEATRVVRIELAGLTIDREYSVFLDEARLVWDGQPPLLVETDRGRHLLRIETAGFEAFTWEGDTGDGQRIALEATFRPLPERRVIIREPAVPVRSIFKSPWFWVVTGAVVVAGGAALGWYLYDDAQLNQRNADHEWEL